MTLSRGSLLNTLSNLDLLVEVEGQPQPRFKDLVRVAQENSTTSLTEDIVHTTHKQLPRLVRRSLLFFFPS